MATLILALFAGLLRALCGGPKGAYKYRGHRGSSAPLFPRHRGAVTAIEKSIRRKRRIQYR